MKTKLLSPQEYGLTQTEFDTAVAGLIEKGLVEVDEEEGVPYYYLNKMGFLIGDHLDSDSSKRN